MRSPSRPVHPAMPVHRATTTHAPEPVESEGLQIACERQARVPLGMPPEVPSAKRQGWMTSDERVCPHLPGVVPGATPPPGRGALTRKRRPELGRDTVE